jgi:FIMAH domain
VRDTPARVGLRAVLPGGSGGDVFKLSILVGSHNLIEDGSGGLPDTITGNPMLGPLADNGGPTLTFALLPGSPALNAGDDALAVDVNGNRLAFDQRGPGFKRFAGTVDIGAFELSPKDRAEDLIAQIDDLVAGGSLNSGQANALEAKLEAALQKIDDGRISVAINELNAFIKQVQSYVKAGTLSAAEGAALIEAADELLASITI